MMDKKLKNGFSLSENLAVLVVVGLIIAFTVPKLIVSRNMRNNRLTVRKSIVAYQGILDKEIASATGVRTTAALNTILLGNDNQCQKVREQLQVKSFTAGNGCDFTTEDDVRWNLSTNGPSHAVIAIKGAEPNYNNASDANNNRVFYIPFAVRGRGVRVLNFEDNAGLNNQANAVNKTRDFIIGE